MVEAAGQRWSRVLGLVTVFAFCGVAGAQPAGPGVPIEGERATGEDCLVCGKPVADEHDGIVLTFQGRRVFLHGDECPDCLQGWIADPDLHFRALQARSALFDEGPGSRMGEVRMNRAWLYFGLYVLVGLLFGGMCSALAVARGHRPLPWFALGLVLNLIGLVLLLTRGRGDQKAVDGVPPGLRKVPVTYSPLPCGKCGAENHPSADACSSCHAALDPRVESEVSRIQGP